MSDTLKTDEHLETIEEFSGKKHHMVSAHFARELERKNNALLDCLNFAAELISTMPQFSDKHPEEVLQWLKEEARR